MAPNVLFIELQRRSNCVRFETIEIQIQFLNWLVPIFISFVSYTIQPAIMGIEGKSEWTNCRTALLSAKLNFNIEFNGLDRFCWHLINRLLGKWYAHNYDLAHKIDNRSPNQSIRSQQRENINSKLANYTQMLPEHCDDALFCAAFSLLTEPYKYIFNNNNIAIRWTMIIRMAYLRTRTTQCHRFT